MSAAGGAGTRRIVGIAATVVAAAALVWTLRAGHGDERDAAVRRGVGHVLTAVARDPGAGVDGPAAREALDRARAAFRDALRAAPFDPYAAYLLHLVDRLEGTGTIDPSRGVYERALSLVAEGRIEAARLLLMESGGRGPGDAERHLLRFLHQAAVVRGATGEAAEEARRTRSPGARSGDGPAPAETAADARPGAAAGP